MKNNSVSVVDVPCLNKVKFWLYSLYVAILICLGNVLTTFWRKSGKAKAIDKPLACLVSNKLGNHSYIKVNGVKFHYVEVGGKRKPMALLLHGFPDCWIGWRQQLKDLSNHFRVVAVDLKGFGDSEKPQWCSAYGVKIIAEELRELVQALGAQNCVVIGHDLGAMLGWYMAALYPDTVTKFVAISCPHPNVHWDHLPVNTLLNAKFIHLCQIPLLPVIEFRKSNLEIVNKLYKPHLQKNGESELLGAYRYVFSRSEDVTGPINYLRNLPLSRLNPGRIVVPTLLIVGSRDAQVAVESMVRSVAFLETHELKLVEEAGHFPHQEFPQEVNELLKDFLVERPAEQLKNKAESLGLINNLVSSTFKYGGTLVDSVKKTTNGVSVWRPQLLKSSG